MFSSIENLTRQWRERKAREFAAAIGRGCNPEAADAEAEAATKAAFRARKDLNPDYEWCDMREEYVLSARAAQRQREADMDI